MNHSIKETLLKKLHLEEDLINKYLYMLEKYNFVISKNKAKIQYTYNLNPNDMISLETLINILNNDNIKNNLLIYLEQNHFDKIRNEVSDLILVIIDLVFDEYNINIKNKIFNYTMQYFNLNINYNKILEYNISISIYINELLYNILNIENSDAQNKSIYNHNKKVLLSVNNKVNPIINRYLILTTMKVRDIINIDNKKKILYIPKNTILYIKDKKKNKIKKAIISSDLYTNIYKKDLVYYNNNHNHNTNSIQIINPLKYTPDYKVFDIGDKFKINKDTYVIKASKENTFIYKELIFNKKYNSWHYKYKTINLNNYNIKLIYKFLLEVNNTYDLNYIKNHPYILVSIIVNKKNIITKPMYIYGREKYGYALNKLINNTYI